MAALEAALEQAIAGNAQVVGVVAEPGTGKSRLCYELAERCRAREIPVYEGHGVSHGKTIPLLPALEFQGPAETPVLPTALTRSGCEVALFNEPPSGEIGCSLVVG
jgi:predicted ATPase